MNDEDCIQNYGAEPCSENSTSIDEEYKGLWTREVDEIGSRSFTMADIGTDNV